MTSLILDSGGPSRLAEPGGTVLTGDIDDLSALADHADNVSVTRV